MCEVVLYLRKLIWEKDGEWERCETEGIHLKSDRTYDFHWRTPPYNFELSDDKDMYISNTEEFISCIRVFILGFFNLSYLCDVCSDTKPYDNIYFCKLCDKKYKEDKENKKDDGWDCYNLCDTCYTPENIKSHVCNIDELGHDCFIMKETQQHSFMRHLS
jgi:hypothetical protein